MKALLAGFGGIGANVYYPELQKLGYEVDVLDLVAPTATFKNIQEVKEAYDIAVVCTPNYTHRPIAEHLAMNGTKSIFVEKPGLSTSQEWWDMCTAYKDTKFHLVKNNLYRAEYGGVLEMMKIKDVIGIDIQWISDNRIPSPGSWFTTQKTAFGGVSRDLMPHLYCFAVKLLGPMTVAEILFIQSAIQRWDLKSISSTDYGTVNPKGTYNVDDHAMALGSIDEISVKLYATWKAGYNKQSVTLYFRDGTSFEWEFGLCPAEAYGTMLQDDSDSTKIDMDLHYFLETFRNAG